MTYWERRLPHWIPDETPIFVTWRLAGTLPRGIHELNWEDADARLDRNATGPRWLAQPAVAEIVGQALQYGETARQWYRLYAWVVMPNHVHVVMTPQHAFSGIMRWLKWTTARRCNQILGRTGVPFWQDESYDHWIRSGDEMQRIVGYVEWNPVAAGLVERAEDWIWSSACEQEKRVGQAILSPACPRK